MANLTVFSFTQVLLIWFTIDKETCSFTACQVECFYHIEVLKVDLLDLGELKEIFLLYRQELLELLEMLKTS